MRVPLCPENLDATPEGLQAQLAVATPVRAPLSEQEWRVLVRRYAGALAHTLRRRVALTSDVEDLVQQALLQAVVGWPAFRGEAAVSTWVFGIAHNLARNHVTRPTRLEQSGLDETLDLAQCPAPGPGERLAQREAVCQLQEGFDHLPVNQREALWLVGVDGLSYDEAATTLGVSVAAIKHRVARARFTLRSARD